MLVRNFFTFLGVLFTAWSYSQVTFTPQNFTSFFTPTKNCVVDMNGDFLDDIVGLSRDGIEIYYQEPDGTFTYSNFRKNLSVTADWSICAGDIDGNGFNDLLVGGEHFVSFIYANGTGSDYTEFAMPDSIFSQRTSFADIDNDGHLDAFICHDENENHPYRNDGMGNLTLDRNLLKTPEDTPGNYAVTWVDYDNDGDTDMYLTKCVASAQLGDPDRTNLLYINNGAGNYTEGGVAANLDDNSQSWVSIFEDFDNDGDFDVAILNHSERNKLMRNNGDATFTDVTIGSGFDDVSLGAFEGIAADLDNDGNMDFIVDRSPKIYFGNGDLTFRRFLVGVPSGAVGDFNSDGFVDFAQRDVLYISDTNANNWIRINTIGSESNRNGIGARVEIHGSWGVQIREVRATQSWSPMSTLGIHFGIAQATSIDSLVIKWPSGNKSVIENPDINQALTVEESGCPFIRPEIVVDGDLLLCPGDIVTLSAPDGYENYLWSSGESGPSIQVGYTGAFNVTMTNSEGCSFSSKIIKASSVKDAVDIRVRGGTDFCKGGTVRLLAESSLDFVWNTGEESNINVVSEEGDYFVNIDNGCGVEIYSDTITLTEIIVDPPIVQDYYVDPDTNLVAVTAIGDSVIWWDDPVGGQFLFAGNVYYVSEFLMDQTFYVQEVKVLENGAECYSERVPITIYLGSDLTELEHELDLKIFPNPAYDIISVFVNDKSTIKEISIWDINGEPILKQADHFSTTSTIDIGNLNAGVYILQLRVKENIISKRVLIAK